MSFKLGYPLTKGHSLQWNIPFCCCCCFPVLFFTIAFLKVVAHLLYLFEIVTTLVEITIQMQCHCIGEGIIQLYLSLNTSTSTPQSQTLTNVTRSPGRPYRWMRHYSRMNKKSVQNRDMKVKIMCSFISFQLIFDSNFSFIYFETYSTSSENMASNQNSKLSFCIPKKSCIRNGVFRWEKYERRWH